MEDDPRLTPAIDLIRRTGARSVGIRYQDDEKPTVWLAVVEHVVGDDGRPTSGEGRCVWEVDAGHDPVEAVLRLCARLIDGGECVHCGKPSAFMEDLSPTFGDALMCWYAWDPELSTFRRSCEGSAS